MGLRFLLDSIGLLERLGGIIIVPEARNQSRVVVGSTTKDSLEAGVALDLEQSLDGVRR